MTSDKPLVSVIITYHNEGDLLRNALDSVNAQTFDGPVEIVVVDDASTLSPTLPPVSRFPIHLVRSEENIFLPAARNLGVRNSSGQYLAFLDADDVFVDDRMARHVVYLQKHPEVLLVGGSHYVHRDGKVWLQIPDFIEKYYPELGRRECVLPTTVRHDLCLEYGFHTGATTVRRSAIDLVGGFATYIRSADEWDLLVRVAQHGFIGYVPHPADRYLCRPTGSITTTMNPEKFEAAARMFRSWRRTIAGLPAGHREKLRIEEGRYWLLASQAYLEKQGRSGPALRCALAALRCRPSKWGVRSAIRSALHGCVPGFSRLFHKPA